MKPVSEEASCFPTGLAGGRQVSFNLRFFPGALVLPAGKHRAFPVVRSMAVPADALTRRNRTVPSGKSICHTLISVQMPFAGIDLMVRAG